MSPTAALRDPTFRAYLMIVGGVLLAAGAVLAGAFRFSGRDLRPVWRTYKSWLFMAPLVAAAVLLGRGAVVLGVCVLSIFAFKEFARASGLYADWWMTGAAYCAIVAVALASYAPDPSSGRPGWYGLYMAMPLFAACLFLVVPVVRDRTSGQLQNVSLATVGFLQIGWMFGALGFLANASHPYGYLAFVLLAAELNDVAAFVTGRLLGRRQLRPAVSPSKTWEGAAGALLVSIILPWLLWFSFPHFGVGELVLAGLIVGVGGQLGDLSVSVIKRYLGVKDMGRAIPGHGGILDRIDSLTFVAPLFLQLTRAADAGAPG